MELNQFAAAILTASMAFETSADAGILSPKERAALKGLSGAIEFFEGDKSSQKTQANQKIEPSPKPSQEQPPIKSVKPTTPNGLKTANYILKTDNGTFPINSTTGIEEAFQSTANLISGQVKDGKYQISLKPDNVVKVGTVYDNAHEIGTCYYMNFTSSWGKQGQADGWTQQIQCDNGQKNKAATMNAKSLIHQDPTTPNTPRIELPIISGGVPKIPEPGM